MDRDITLYLPGLPVSLKYCLASFHALSDGFAAAGGEEDPVQVARRVVGEALGQFDGRWRGERPQREEGQRLGLLGSGLGEFGAAVTDLDDEEPGQGRR